jgi:hypothetical protein
VATTRLSLSGHPGRAYGSFTHGATVGTHTGTFTRLALTGTPGRLYGSFAGRGAATEDTKTSSFSIIPRVTIGDVTDVELETTLTAIPRSTLSSAVGRNTTVSMSCRPVVTQARGSILSSTILKTSSPSLVPVVTLSTALYKDITTTQSLIPVVTLSSSVDDTYVETLNSQSLIPVVTLTAEVLGTTEPKSNDQSLIPVVTLQHQLNRINSSQAWDVVQTIAPRVTLTCTAGRAGEVDRIEIIGKPYGYIEITPT